MIKSFRDSASILLRIAALLLGSGYFLSGFGKALEINYFYETIGKYGFDSLRGLAPVIVVMEIALALLFIMNFHTRLASLISIIVLVIFTSLFSYAYVFRSVDDCGCFGSWSSSFSVGWFYARNVSMLFISIIIYKVTTFENSPARYKKIIFFFVLLITAYTAGFTHNRPLRKNNGNNKDLNFEGMHINNTPLLKYAPVSGDSAYMMFFFTYGCNHCLNSLENIRQYTASNYIQNIILIGTGDTVERDQLYTNFDLRYNRFDISKTEMHTITRQFPVSYFVVNDTIRRRWKGMLPVHQILRKKHFLNINQ